MLAGIWEWFTGRRERTGRLIHCETQGELSRLLGDEFKRQSEQDASVRGVSAERLPIGGKEIFPGDFLITVDRKPIVFRCQELDITATNSAGEPIPATATYMVCEEF